MIKGSFLTLAVTCAAVVAAAQEVSTRVDAPVMASVTPEVRQHISVVSPSGIDDYVVSQIQRLSEKDDKTVVLIRTSAGDRLIATHDWNYQTQLSYSEIRDERSGEFLRVTVTYGFATRTRSSTLEQAKKAPQLLNSDVPFEISGPGNTRVSGIESHWRDPATARDWRVRIRQMITPLFLEQLEIADSSGLFSEPILSSLHDILMQFVLYRTSCDSPANLHVAPAIPDCGFDKDFGFACSEDQLKRAEAAASEKKAKRY